ncbi:MAG: diacylglycerol/lipid kinase family protein [Planctomycetota bacterium]
MSNGSTSPRRLLLIANPISGGGRGRLLAPQLAAALAARSVHAEVHFTTAAGDARARAQKAGGEAWDGLVAIGGDGTVNEVLNGMPDPSRPLGTLPVGTANVLALELGLPRRVDAAADVLAQGHVRRLAIGRCGEQRFLLFCGFGVDGEVVRAVAARRSGTLGKHKYLVPIAKTLWHWPRFALRATLADGEVLDDLGMVLVTRVRGYGGVLRLPREVSPYSGVLHVLGFRHRARTAWLGLGLCGMTFGLRAGRNLVVRSTTSVLVDGTAPFQIDGDYGGSGPQRIALEQEAAHILAPAR